MMDDGGAVVGVSMSLTPLLSRLMSTLATTSNPLNPPSVTRLRNKEAHCATRQPRKSHDKRLK